MNICLPIYWINEADNVYTSPSGNTRLSTFLKNFADYINEIDFPLQCPINFSHSLPKTHLFILYIQNIQIELYQCVAKFLCLRLDMVSYYTAIPLQTLSFIPEINKFVFVLWLDECMNYVVSIKTAVGISISKLVINPLQVVIKWNSKYTKTLWFWLHR